MKVIYCDHQHCKVTLGDVLYKRRRLHNLQPLKSSTSSHLIEKCLSDQRRFRHSFIRSEVYQIGQMESSVAPFAISKTLLCSISIDGVWWWWCLWLGSMVMAENYSLPASQNHTHLLMMTDVLYCHGPLYSLSLTLSFSRFASEVQVQGHPECVPLARNLCGTRFLRTECEIEYFIE